MKKRIISLVLSVMLSAAVLTGCSGKSDSGAGKEAGKKENSKSDSLIMPVSATVKNLNRLLESMSEGWFQLAGFSDELYYVDTDETRYYLADSCEVSDDGLTYTLKLKENLKWHDGEAITADDLVFTMKCIADTDNGAGFTNTAFVNEKPVTVEKVDELTVSFRLPEVSSSYFELLGKVTPIPEHAFKGNTDIVSAGANLSDIGSGPYKLVEFKDGESLVLERFDDYYGDKPQINQVIYKVIADPSAQEVAFKNGEINYLGLSTDTSANEYKKMENVNVVELQEARVNYLAWNKYSKTWKDKDAVKALFSALNKEEIVEGAYGSAMGAPANSIFSPRTLFYDESVPGYKQDLNQAKKLAKSSGLSGKTIKLYYNADRVFMKETALVIQQQLKEIDVNVNVEGLESNGFFDTVFSDAADYELYLNGYGAEGDPDGVVTGMYNGTWGVNVDTSKNLLELFEKASKTTDTEERRNIYSEIQKGANEEDLVYPIAYPSYCFAVPSNLKGADYYKTTPVFEDYTKLRFE